MAGDVTLIVPSVASRADMFRRVLIHFAQSGHDGPIVVSDHSAEDERNTLAAIAAEFPGLSLSLRHHAPDLPFLARLADCAEAAETPYTALHADDDFVYFPVLALCAAFLDANPDYAAAKGRMAFFSLDGGNLAINAHRGRSREEANVFTRLTRHMASFSATLYAVHRRAPFIDGCRRTVAATDNVIFWQYLSSCITVVRGKVKTLDEFYYLRQQNPQGWQETLIAARDPGHWPHLVTAPDFSRHLADFRTALLAYLAESAGPSPPGFAEGFADALVWLIRHGLAKQQLEPPEAAEDAVYKRLEDPACPESRFLSSCLVTVVAPEKVQARLIPTA